MYVNLSKKFITENLLPHLSRDKPRQENRKCLCGEVVKAIIYRLKSGCQWREIPSPSAFCGNKDN